MKRRTKWRENSANELQQKKQFASTELIHKVESSMRWYQNTASIVMHVDNIIRWKRVGVSSHWGKLLKWERLLVGTLTAESSGKGFTLGSFPQHNQGAPWLASAGNIVLPKAREWTEHAHSNQSWFISQQLRYQWYSYFDKMQLRLQWKNT